MLIKDTLVEDNWDINKIKFLKDITIVIWKNYSFLISTLPQIREKIKKFKRQKVVHYK